MRQLTLIVLALMMALAKEMNGVNEKITCYVGVICTKGVGLLYGLFTGKKHLAGPHLSVYEDYWKFVDSNGLGSVAAQDAAAFLKRSGLSDVILSKIWELSDTGAKGCLDKQGFFCSLKLIALVQSGQEASLGNLTSSTGPPNLGQLPPKSASNFGSTTGWRVTAHEKSRYDGIFQTLQPVNGKLPGDKVKPVLMNSNLPVDTLGKIWELSDHDKDGQFDCEEFAVAMHLVYNSLEKKPLPPTIPADLVPPSHRSHVTAPPVGGVQVLPVIPTLNTGSSIASEASAKLPVWSSPPSSVLSSNDINIDTTEEVVGWVISPQYQLTSDHRFSQLDTNNDGLVNGAEIRDVLLQSGLNQQTLAAIWGLCDVQSNGFLNREQFALAQWLIEEKVTKGRDPPPLLSSDMIPPSLRGSAAVDPIHTNTELSGELLQIEAEIEEIKRRKIQLEAEKQQKDADVKIRSGEVQTLQKEYEAISGTTLQLERQRGEAQKKLDELEDQKSRFESEVTELKEKCTQKQREIDEINQQLSQQDRLEQDQVQELGRLKDQYSELHSEASRLEKQIETSRGQFNQLGNEKTSMTEEVKQATKHVEELRGLNETIEIALKQYQALLNDEAGATEPDLSTIDQPTPLRNSQPLSTSNRSTPINHQLNNTISFGFGQPDTNNAFSGFDAFGSSNSTTISGNGFSGASKSDPFGSTDPFTEHSAFNVNAFGGDQPFKSDPFEKEDPFKSDPFSGSDPFKDSVSNSDAFGGGGTSFKVSSAAPESLSLRADTSRPKSTDPFSSSDPFGSALQQPIRSASTIPTANHSSDPFDPFRSTSTDESSSTNFNDPFGFDPFASSNKEDEKKKPPPRPALPRPKATTPNLESSNPLFNPDPFKMSASPQNKQKGNRPKAVTPNTDAFGGFDADPFGGSDPFGGASNGSASKSDDPFTANFANFGSGFETPSSDKDLAWAKVDSENVETERKRKLAEQEQADFEFALALSKAES